MMTPSGLSLLLQHIRGLIHFGKLAELAEQENVLALSSDAVVHWFDTDLQTDHVTHATSG